MPTSEIISLLVQVPLLGVFVWFTLRISRDFREDTKARDSQWQIFLSQQNELWRNFVRELTEKSCTADDMVGQRLFELARIIDGLTADIKAHDAKTDAILIKRP